ncbi:ABC transporter substrate-binding protein [Microvirga sp. VF16]|uniref:ABC transporter substrate-binding protein n=1 Tax=Microvirga sp. VF16 TaxID=2807101 RepID=UPI00193D0FD1|nr:ABC transporter substrate-binding protein [Microvirga sp. VF16]QRM33289.1 ABC transporter substrate-binding protein [Microvirga sp. VF16]
MSLLINRRHFLQGSSAIAAGALAAPAGGAFAQSSNELRVVTYGGESGKGVLEAYVKPFQAQTGIKVTPISQDFDPAQLELMAKSNNVTADVVPLIQGALASAAAKGMLEKIDYSRFRPEDLNGIVDFAKDPYGVGTLIYSYNMVWNTKKFPAGKPRPTNWAEFWDVKQFPGTRFLVAGQYGSEGPWEEALLADGVPADKLYPMDIDRIFASLDKIKPHIRKWWTSGSEIQQLMRSGSGDVMMSYDGRANSSIDQGSPLEINRNQAKMTWDYWVIPKGSPNAENAQKFIEFACRAENQANLAKHFPEGPVNRNAFKLLPEELARKLPTYPEYLAKSIPINGQWYSEVGPDGLTNAQQLVKRWSDWVLR